MPDEGTQQPQAGAEQAKPAVEPEVKADEFDKARAMATIEKLREFEKQAKAQAKKLADYEAKEKERQEAELSETDKLKKQLAEALAQVKQRDHETLQRQAAEEVGIPASFAKRLVGETIEDMKADAELILKELPKAQQPKVGATNPGANATGAGETNAQKLARIHGQGVDMFNPAEAAKHGGGVIFTTKTEG